MWPYGKGHVAEKQPQIASFRVLLCSCHSLATVWAVMVCLCFMKWDIMAVVDASDPQPSFSSIKWAWRTQKTLSHCAAPDNSLAAPHRPPSLNYCSGLVERNRRGWKEWKEERRGEWERKRERDLLFCLCICKKKNPLDHSKKWIRCGSDRLIEKKQKHVSLMEGKHQRHFITGVSLMCH